MGAAFAVGRVPDEMVPYTKGSLAQLQARQNHLRRLNNDEIPFIITREQFRVAFEVDGAVVDQHFAYFDPESRGRVAAMDVFGAFALLVSEKLVSKLKYLFALVDLDFDRHINQSELVMLMTSCCRGLARLKRVAPPAEADMLELAQEAWRVEAAWLNEHGDISLDSLVRFCNENVQTRHFFSDVNPTDGSNFEDVVQLRVELEGKLANIQAEIHRVEERMRDREHARESRAAVFPRVRWLQRDTQNAQEREASAAELAHHEQVERRVQRKREQRKAAAMQSWGIRGAKRDAGGGGAGAGAGGAGGGGGGGGGAKSKGGRVGAMPTSPRARAQWDREVEAMGVANMQTFYSRLPQDENGRARLDLDTFIDILEAAGADMPPEITDAEALEALASFSQDQLGRYSFDDIAVWWRARRVAWKRSFLAVSEWSKLLERVRPWPRRALAWFERQVRSAAMRMRRLAMAGAHAVGGAPGGTRNAIVCVMAIGDDAAAAMKMQLELIGGGPIGSDSHEAADRRRHRGQTAKEVMMQYNASERGIQSCFFVDFSVADSASDEDIADVVAALEAALEHDACAALLAGWCCGVTVDVYAPGTPKYPVPRSVRLAFFFMRDPTQEMAAVVGGQNPLDCVSKLGLMLECSTSLQRLLRKSAPFLRYDNTLYEPTEPDIPATADTGTRRVLQEEFCTVPIPLTDFGRDTVRQVFELYDLDHDGGWSFSEVNRFLRSLGHPALPTAADWERALAKFNLPVENGQVLPAGLEFAYQRSPTLAADLEALGVGSLDQHVAGKIAFDAEFSPDALAALEDVGAEPVPFVDRWLKRFTFFPRFARDLFVDQAFERLSDAIPQELDWLRRVVRRPGWLARSVNACRQMLAHGDTGMLVDLRADAERGFRQQEKRRRRIERGGHVEPLTPQEAELQEWRSFLHLALEAYDQYRRIALGVHAVAVGSARATLRVGFEGFDIGPLLPEGKGELNHLAAVVGDETANESDDAADDDYDAQHAAQMKAARDRRRKQARQGSLADAFDLG